MAKRLITKEGEMKDLTQERIKELLDYNEYNGVFTWKKRNGNVAGWVNSDGYRRIGVDRYIYKCSRLAFLYMTGSSPINSIDHINHIKDDDRWENLRDVLAVDNARNMPLKKSNKTGICGVFFREERGEWMSYITCFGKKLHLYLGNDFFEACCVRKSAEVKHGFHENHGKDRPL